MAARERIYSSLIEVVSARRRSVVVRDVSDVCWRWRLVRASGALILLASVCQWGCAEPQTSGESHFGSNRGLLRVCEDGVCENGDDCSCGVCTVPCAGADDCAARILGPGSTAEDLPANVVCRAPACGATQADSAASADNVCEVTCAVDGDCAFLDASQSGGTHICSAGACRTVAAPEDPVQVSAPDALVLCPQGRALVPQSASPSFAGYCLDIDEVSVADYTLCVDSGLCTEPDAGNYLTSGRELHPVQNVSVEQAESYCSSIGARLPSFEEWAAAFALQSYPWGSEVPTVSDVPQRVCGLSATTTCSVGAYAAGTGPFGHEDLSGNVAELVHSGSDYCAAGGGYSDPADAMTSSSCVAFSAPELTIGFRCLSDL